MSALITLDQIHVSGTPESMGIQQGEALKERITKFLNVRFAAVDQYARDRGRESAAGLLDIGREKPSKSTPNGIRMAMLNIVGLPMGRAWTRSSFTPRQT